MAIPPVRALVVGLLAVLVVTAGCSEGRTGSEADPPLPASDINPVERDRVRDGGTMRWPLRGYPLQWNYLHVAGNNEVTADLIGALMPRLWRHDEHGVARPDPDYLRRAEVTATRPKQVVTYTIHPKAKWSDGTPITWRDFQSQFRAMNGRDPRYQAASTVGYEQIESVARGAHDREVVVTYARPFSDWQAMFDPLYPASTTRDPDVFNNGWLEKAPVTAGPFRLAKVDSPHDTIVVERDESFWGDRARLDRIVFQALSPEDELRAFLDGRLSFAGIGTDPSRLRRLKARKGTVIRRAGSPDYSVITFNGARAPLSDLRVRQAVARAIDRTAITRAVHEGLGWPAVPMDNHFFVNTQAGYQDNAGGLGDHDREAAAALLDSAGWKKRPGDRYRTKGGQELVLHWPNPSGSPLSKQIGRLVRGMLAQVGIRVVTREVPARDYFERYIRQGDFDLAPSAWSGTPYPVSFSRSIYAVPSDDADGSPVAVQNFAGIGSERIDATLDRALRTLSPERARALANRADALIWRSMHSLPLYQQLQIRAVDPRLANFGANGFRSIRYQDIGFVR